MKKVLVLCLVLFSLVAIRIFVTYINAQTMRDYAVPDVKSNDSWTIVLEQTKCDYGVSDVISYGNVVFDMQGQPVTGVVCSYENGRLKVGISYKNGKKEVAKVYYENGRLKTEFPFKNGELEGVVKEYYENGRLRGEMPFKNGKEEGVTKIYDENGRLKIETPYKNGKREGDKKHYYSNGKLNFKILFRNGEPVSGACGDGRNLTSTEVIKYNNTGTLPDCGY